MIADKLSQPRMHLNSDDLTPNQKSFLWEVMARHGAKQGFSYDRFFEKGFFRWELIGITAIKHDFIRAHIKEIFPEQEPEDIEKVVAEIDVVDGEFYRMLGRSFGLKKKFHAYISELGMSTTTSLKRFSADDWEEFERIGIRAIIEEFEREVPEVPSAFSAKQDMCFNYQQMNVEPMKYVQTRIPLSLYEKLINMKYFTGQRATIGDISFRAIMEFLERHPV